MPQNLCRTMEFKKRCQRESLWISSLFFFNEKPHYTRPNDSSSKYGTTQRGRTKTKQQKKKSIIIMKMSKVSDFSSKNKSYLLWFAWSGREKPLEEKKIHILNRNETFNFFFLLIRLRLTTDSWKWLPSCRCCCYCRCFVTLGATASKFNEKKTIVVSVVFDVAVSSSVAATQPTINVRIQHIRFRVIIMCMCDERGDGRCVRADERPLSLRFDKTKCVACRHDIRWLFFRRHTHTHTPGQERKWIGSLHSQWKTWKFHLQRRVFVDIIRFVQRRMTQFSSYDEWWMLLK